MLLAADNLTACRPSVRRALLARDEEFVALLCADAARRGAHWLDLNPGFVPLASRSELWRFLVGAAERACDLTLMLDAPDPASLELALGFCTRPPILNMATAQPERLAPVLDIAACHGVAVVAATMTALAPADAAERLALAALIVEQAGKRGIAGERLILDPMALPLGLSGGEAQAWAVIQTLRALPFLFDPPPLTMLAISNLVTASAGRRAAFAAAPFLAAAWGAGLAVAMLDVTNPELMRTARLCSVLGGERIFAPAEYASE